MLHSVVTQLAVNLIGEDNQVVLDAELRDAFEVLATEDAAGLKVLTDCKLRLAQKLGQRWNPSWEPTGFPGQSTAVRQIFPPAVARTGGVDCLCGWRFLWRGYRRHRLTCT